VNIDVLPMRLPPPPIGRAELCGACFAARSHQAWWPQEVNMNFLLLSLIPIIAR